MNIQNAKNFLNELVEQNLHYHLDDDAADCLRNATTPEKAKAIQKTVDEIYQADLDWGKSECPIGYLLELLNDEVAS
tara:strand:+ start:45 stop:275 length:231 start_codon:yes stop_codon:yes gene_type:complete